MEKKLLIVEDDEMIASMYRTKLEQEGFKVLIANDGALGLSMAASQNPDLVLLDIIMPQLDGFTVLRELKSGAKTKKIPVIMLTNLGTDEDKKKGNELGAVDYLVKAGLTPAQVAEAVKKYLAKKDK